MTMDALAVVSFTDAFSSVLTADILKSLHMDQLVDAVSSAASAPNHILEILASLLLSPLEVSEICQVTTNLELSLNSLPVNHTTASELLRLYLAAASFSDASVMEV
jgi:hypothetical protein